MTPADFPSAYRIFVVGCNRQRLLKIMEIAERELKDGSGSDSEENRTDNASDFSDGDLEASFKFTFLPCVARMDAYRDADGRTVRYLASLVYHDGSSLTQFFDDEEIRETLSAAIMVGYEWQDGDRSRLQNYFVANKLQHLEVELVRPNVDFDFLRQEMDHFRSLDAAAREKHVADKTMGPGKMARCVVDMRDHIREEKLEILRNLQKEQGGPAGNPSANTSAAAAAAAAAVDGKDGQEDRPQKVPDPAKQRYACRKCRYMLIDEDDLCNDHVRNLHSFGQRNYSQKTSPTATCQSIFCRDDVLHWLAPDGCDVEGRLECPKCTAKIGHWKWSGTQCSCGTWITPSIQIPLSKVDVVQPGLTTELPAGVVTSPLLNVVRPVLPQNR